MQIRAAGMSLLLLALTGAAVAAPDGIELLVRPGFTPDEVRLDWTGGAAPFLVHRASAPADISNPLNELGGTSGRSWLDTPPEGSLYFYAVLGSCVPGAEICDGEDNDCDGFTDEGCGTPCSQPGDCAPEEYCDGGGTCRPDEPDGTACGSDEECVSDHCSNGFCCQAGVCCSTGADCDAFQSPPTCDDAAHCQGSRADGICDAGSQCTSNETADDSACDSSIQSQTCGLFRPVLCTGAATQPSDQASLCPLSCDDDLGCVEGAHCDGSICVADSVLGTPCDESSDCISGLCVDGVCCDSSCAALCEACDVAGAEGSCSVIPAGQDPDAECAALDCTGYYAGFIGDTCYRRADLASGAVDCDGAGACETADGSCPSSSTGPATLTCDSLCQDPQAGTCVGTTPGGCVNVDAGDQTCGSGVCQVTVPLCTSGSPNTCVPNSGAASPEVCNNVDDNCNGVIDDGSFADAFEPNNSCSSYTTLATVGSNQTRTYSSQTIFGSGDNDYYRIVSSESDSSCSCCDVFCLDEDFQLRIRLTVPSGAGSYAFCTGATCGTVDSNCQTVLAGQFKEWTWTLDGACPGQDDYAHFVRIYGNGSPGYECLPYTLSYTFTPGCY